ncbi:DUF397 domain-containing protein [Streptomyces sp. WI04-05B]|uniref:DUF397 domain-containing protein n=1 Tax=Streptomyces TaxID=1883 RepID=UPI0029BC1892|nr:MULTISPECIES: DUF397 domain-containing protein [unclassified Streptomyces]MDX2543844.1 DUF397 domain-containing protein [Streptomyces sp. WI04-05B]MDX2582066.1 DUF397 domain-containing protein [Streptomyces sp. WI04-05A]MDX3752478.1 DUF397 domain-containing protein [Streptomyces sp. AK08-02]
MTLPLHWQKSSFSEGGDGNTCVEIADVRTRISIRDSKDPARGTLSFPPRAFATFVEVLKTGTSRTTT